MYLGAVSSLGESNIQEQGKAVFFLHTVRNFHLAFIFQSDRKDVVIAQSEVKSGTDVIFGCLFLLNDDIGIIKKFNLLDDSDKGNIVPSGFDYLEGVAHHDGVIKYKPTWDVVEWFKYNHCLIGKPERIVIFQCSKSSL